MESNYSGVKTRFLEPYERLIVSSEKEMPLVIEPDGAKDSQFLQNFLTTYSTQILADIAKYGAVLLRGFDVASEKDFEKSVLSIQGLQGISDAFMSEQGRIPVPGLKFVLHTNAIYKTGGTLYLGGFHSENYYSPDVPTYICFCCLKPSSVGGETGLVNMEKIYPYLNNTLKSKLEKNTFFVSKWWITEVIERYGIAEKTIEEICTQFNLPIIGEGKNKFILMYKPSVFEHPETKKKSLQINLFELPTLNAEMRKCFMNDYQGKTWFWHRFVWRLPNFIFKPMEVLALALGAFFYSPKEALKILHTKYHAKLAAIKTKNSTSFNHTKVGSCFNRKEVKELAQLIRNYYCSCLWKKGDILLVDNRKVVHAGMPGAGPRLIRAMIVNPMDMQYSFLEPGYLNCKERTQGTVGSYMTTPLS